MLNRPLKEQFAAATRRLLRPLVRQLIAYGITYPVFSQMAKELYAEVAEEDFALPFKRITDSRLALVTGLNRKEIARWRRRPRTTQAAVEVEDTVVTHVIGRWMAAPPYADRAGAPRELPYDSARASTVSFTRLVHSLGVDIPVRSVLDELLRLQLIELSADGTVRIRQEAHIPTQDVEGKLTLLGSDPAELFRTIVHNIEQPEDAWLQRKVVYDNIGTAALDQLRSAARNSGEEFIRQANALLASYDRDRNPSAPAGKRMRVVLGTYYFEEDTTPPAPSRKVTGAHPPGRIRRSR